MKGGGKKQQTMEGNSLWVCSIVSFREAVAFSLAYQKMQFYSIYSFFETIEIMYFFGGNFLL